MIVLKPTIRTITVFLTLKPENFEVSWGSLFSPNDLGAKIDRCAKLLRDVEAELTSQGYTVQTLRIATNPFGEWMLCDSAPPDKKQKATKKAKIDVMNRLERLDQLLASHKIEFCSVGAAKNAEEAKRCIDIVSQSHRFSCSKVVEAGDVESANIAADIILSIANLGKGNDDTPKHIQGGLGNFRFCAASYCKPGIPFFPAACGESISTQPSSNEIPLKFAIGLENGSTAQQLLKESKTMRNISTQFRDDFARLLEPIQSISKTVGQKYQATFLGIDSSLNPSLDTTGSVASAIEEVDEVKIFGGPGTLGTAAEITKALQSLPNIKLTGYCGLMLPVCEDTRLADLAGAQNTNKEKGSKSTVRQLRVTDLLSISSVCGVGIDTVPVPGDCSREDLSSLILDVAGIAGRWNKSLSCRVFPVPNGTAGEMTTFDSPFMVNAPIFSLN